MAKMGRPTTDPKDNQFRIRLSDSEVERLEYCQKITGLNKSEIVRKGIDKIYYELLEKEQK